MPQEPPKQSSGMGHFFTGFATSAGKSALMMGIIGILQFAYHAIGAAIAGNSAAFFSTITLPTAFAAAAPSLLLIAAVGIFGGIMATYHNNQPHPAQAHEDIIRNTTIGVTAQAMTPTLAAEVAPEATPEVAEQAPQRNWAARPDIAQRADRTLAERSERNSIESILARGSAADHASAIATQQASATLPTFH